MNAIMHRIEFNQDPQTLYQALTDVKQLSGWWTRVEHANGDPERLRFYFGPNGEHTVDMAVREARPNELVVWRCEAGPWTQTGDFRFEIQALERGCALSFTHSGWSESDDFFRHCNSKWGYFFTVSLKQLVETGTGHPHPQDPDI